ncbi:MAG: acyl--CoA ligase [Hyphomicrobiales bacterium]|nr:acyl--CoA ligase [Hyphomicrobiales bacterium]
MPNSPQRATTLIELIAPGAGAAPALFAPGTSALTYGGLRDLVARTRASLNAHGIGRNDRVAIVLPNGPEMATAFIAVASAATAAPLNPSYRSDEFKFYLEDLHARALVVEAGSSSPAVEVARELGIMVLTLQPEAAQGAGAFTLAGEGQGPCTAGPAEADDIALILHTSGTTSRPKIVPLSQRNISVSAGNIAATLAFGAHDCGLNIMPLFHIHGLMAGVLAPLSAGGKVFCTPGFNALRFFAWMSEAKPTWYTAVPTMHQAILARAAGHRDIIAQHPLRFMRSSSSSMPPQVIAEMEATFGAPLIEAYGMTEAAHQMVSNPLQGKRIPGSVGLAAGPEVALMNDEGVLLGPGETGEIVIRGANVTAGYEANPQANASAFTKGWFRTGDQGTIDAEGYISLTGRLKEIINRGGEKISPREVDEVLMDHPSVRQAVVFGVKHDKLGEDVAAVIVLREGTSATETDIRQFVSARLAPYKVPRKVLFMEQIPLGATGKLQRIGLAAKLGLE